MFNVVFRGGKNKVFDIAFAILVVGMLLMSFFFGDVPSLVCDDENCTLYVKKGCFSSEKEVKHKIARDNIQNVYVVNYRHKERVNNSSSSSARYISHTDYVPVVVLKNGDEIKLPFKKCHSDAIPNSIAVRIMSGENFVYPTPKNSKNTERPTNYSKTNYNKSNDYKSPLGEPQRF